jgi:hypothetical protein
MAHASVAVRALLAASLFPIISCGGRVGLDTPPTDLRPGEDMVLVSQDQLNAEQGKCVSLRVDCSCVSTAFAYVVDLSESMNDVDPVSGRRDWDLARDALRAGIAVHGAEDAAGLTFFPNRATLPNLTGPVGAAECIDSNEDEGIQALGGDNSSQRNALNAALNRVVPNAQGGAPLLDAYRIGVEAVQRSLLSNPVNGMLVVVANGSPTFDAGCMGTGSRADPVSPEPIIADIARAAASGIHTMVLGGPGSAGDPVTGQDARPWMSRAAQAGGTGQPGCSENGPDYCHIDMTAGADRPSALKRALLVWNGSIPACAFQMPMRDGIRVGPNRVLVTYETRGRTSRILQNAASPCERGWRVSNDGSAIEICGETCDRIQNDEGGWVDVSVRCGP